MSKLNKVPAFDTEREEREFWEAQDSSEYFDLEGEKRGHAQPEALEQRRYP